jgi:hypothetical protein
MVDGHLLATHSFYPRVYPAGSTFGVSCVAGQIEPAMSAGHFAISACGRSRRLLQSSNMAEISVKIMGPSN